MYGEMDRMREKERESESERDGDKCKTGKKRAREL